jgi:hypothetical protein
MPQFARNTPQEEIASVLGLVRKMIFKLILEK